MKRGKLLSLALSIISFTSAFAQTVTVTELTGIAQIEVCETLSLSVEVTKNVGNYNLSDVLLIDLSLPQYIHFTSRSTSNGTLSIDSTNLENPILMV